MSRPPQCSQFPSRAGDVATVKSIVAVATTARQVGQRRRQAVPARTTGPVRSSATLRSPESVNIPRLPTRALGKELAGVLGVGGCAAADANARDRGG